MNNPQCSTRNYQAVVSNDGKVIATHEIAAANRRKAVHVALNWFWYEFMGSMGPAHRSMTVSDPYDEVRYGPNFRCSDRMNKLLPPSVARLLLDESNGELEMDTRAGSAHHPPNSVKRVKRRRDFGRFIAPCIRKMKSGAMYYRIVSKPQQSSAGALKQKRIYRDVRLRATCLAGAIVEIRARGLHIQNQQSIGRKMKVRDLAFAAHVSGLLTASVLTAEQEKKFSRVMGRYKKTAA